MNINETNRFKLLMGYDVKKTLTENLQPILEQPSVWRSFLGVTDDALTGILKKGTLKTTQGIAVQSIDDLKNILKAGSKTALDDASGTLLTNTFLKNPAIRAQDKTNLIKYLTNSDDVITKYKGAPQSDIAKRFKDAGYPDDVADEIANKIANRPAGSTQGFTSKQTAEYKKLADAEKARRAATGQNTNLGQGTREKLIKQVITRGGKTKNLKATHPKPPSAKTPAVETAVDAVKEVSKNWTWPRWLKWGLGLSIPLGALGVWWVLRDGDDIIKPPDMPEESPAPTPNPTIIEIPDELGDKQGVMAFQDWLDDNAEEWATGYKDGKLNQGTKNPGFKSGGYGKFGPRTNAAWKKYKDQYLNSSQTPTETTPNTEGGSNNQNNAGYYDDYTSDEVEPDTNTGVNNNEPIEGD